MPKSQKPISRDKLSRIMKKNGTAVHFVGIGGVSMYSLARLMLSRGCAVSGSDREIGDYARDLVGRGVSVHEGHDRTLINGAEIVVYSSAIAEDNPELVAAREAEIPVVSRAELMGALMMDYGTRIGISGTHGKSTTTAILAQILTHCGTDPTVALGAPMPDGLPLREGGRGTFLYEACEYKDAFLRFHPTIAVALNLEMDHPDYFKNVKELRESFRRALSRAERFALVNVDDENLAIVLKGLKAPVITYGQGTRATYRYLIESFLDHGFTFSLWKYGQRVGKFTLNIPGVFNVNNAAAAVIVALELGLTAESISEALSEFRGVPRRLEFIGERYGRPVFYDYAHHPTEIAASLNAVKLMTHGLVTVVFKPHTFTRTQSLWEEFRLSLGIADYSLIAPIYPAREEPIHGISSERLADELGLHSKFVEDYEVASALDSFTHGTIVIMGAGDMEDIRRDVLYKP